MVIVTVYKVISVISDLKDDDYGIKINGTHVVQAGYHALSMGHCDIDFNEQGEIVKFNGKNELLLGRRVFLDASMSETTNELPYHTAREFIDNHPNVLVCKKDKEVQTLLNESMFLALERYNVT